VELVLEITRLEVPGNNAAVVAACVDHGVLVAVDSTHDVVLVALLLALRHCLVRLNLFLFVVVPNVDLSLPAR